MYESGCRLRVFRLKIGLGCWRAGERNQRAKDKQGLFLRCFVFFFGEEGGAKRGDDLGVPGDTALWREKML
jgi:hypothetical protein